MNKIEKQLAKIEYRLYELEHHEKQEWVKLEHHEKQEWVKIGNLEWLKDRSKEEMSWYDAKKWCEDKGGRLPTRLELLDLFDNHREACQRLIEGDIDNWYWSVTEYSATNAWSVSLSSGYTYGSSKSANAYYVRCCRDSKIRKEENEL